MWLYERIARSILRDDVPDHTTICRRINALDVTLNYDEHAYRTDNNCTMLTVDSSDLQLNDRGEWIREKWNVRRGFIKIHFLVEIKTRKILAFRVTTDRKGDAPQLSGLLEDVKDVLGKRSVLYENGGYDSKENFNYCHRLGVDTRIKVLINSGLKAGGFAHNSAVRDQLGGRKD